MTVFVFLFISFRWEQAEGPAVSPGLGLDLPGERVLRGGRGGQVPGSGAETERIPGRNVVHRFVCLSVFFLTLSF